MSYIQEWSCLRNLLTLSVVCETIPFPVVYYDSVTLPTFRKRNFEAVLCIFIFCRCSNAFYLSIVMVFFYFRRFRGIIKVKSSTDYNEGYEDYDVSRLSVHINIISRL